MRLVARTWSHWSGVDVDGGAAQADAGVVDEDVQGADLLEGALDLGPVADVAGITSGPGLRARMTTSQPSSRKRCAVAAPMPLVPPVTTTRLPARPFIAPSFSRP